MLRYLLPLLFAMFLPLAAQAMDSEKAKIEALIAFVDGFQEALFIRNGSEYDGHKAAEHLREKLSHRQDSVLTARDFIRQCAAKSSVSGKEYMIRFKDQTERPCAEVLFEELKRIEEASESGGK